MERKVIRLNKPLTLPQLYQIGDNWLERLGKIKYELDGCKDGRKERAIR